ncbi:protein kinase domain-containing protein [Sorangium sp. So ce1024]|uniref:protein kinase domain-containing protein n=1 Tax=Sorangium sp. So ce1024 TaxID=3133327 RepID=UPI003F09E004
MLQSRGPLPLAEAADYLLQACEAIAEAHARGIIHRDLKPKNLFLTRRPDGTPLLKVLDFGLSKFIATGDSVKEASLTATGVIMGSIHYMSPEQIRSLKYADIRTDIWALGVILYRMLTGRHPFEGDSITAITAAIIMDTPPSILTLRPDLPPVVEALVNRCLAKDPAARVQSVTEIARVLAPFGSHRARLSFESIDRLLPEPAVRAGSPPALGPSRQARHLAAVVGPRTRRARGHDGPHAGSPGHAVVARQRGGGGGARDAAARVGQHNAEPCAAKPRGAARRRGRRARPGGVRPGVAPDGERPGGRRRASGIEPSAGAHVGIPRGGRRGHGRARRDPHRDRVPSASGEPGAPSEPLRRTHADAGTAAPEATAGEAEGDRERRCASATTTGHAGKQRKQGE